MYSIRHIYAFGDSYTDSGALLQLLHGSRHRGSRREVPLAEVESPHYWEGRWSNGETAIECLARRLGAELTNYAMGGALTGLTNYSMWLDRHFHTGLLAQTERFASHMRAEHIGDDRTLFFLAACANDFLLWDEQCSDQPLRDVAELAAANTVTAVSTLIECGAKTIMVSKCLALGSMPWTRHDSKRAQRADAFEARYNEATERLANALLVDNPVRLLWFDWAQVTRNIERNPDAYGFDNVTDGFISTQAPDADPDRFLWWDDYHPSRRFHALVGDAMFHTLREWVA